MGVGREREVEVGEVKGGRVGGGRVMVRVRVRVRVRGRWWWWLGVEEGVHVEGNGGWRRVVVVWGSHCESIRLNRAPILNKQFNLMRLWDLRRTEEIESG